MSSSSSSSSMKDDGDDEGAVAVHIAGVGSIKIESYGKIVEKAKQVKQQQDYSSSSFFTSSSSSTSTTTKTTTTKTKKPIDPSIDTRVLPIQQERVSIAYLNHISPKPYQIAQNEAIMKSMIPVRYQITDANNAGLAREISNDLIRHKSVVLPLLNATYSDMLLYECGKWPALKLDEKTKTWKPIPYMIRTYPPCIYGNECVCMTYHFEAEDGSKPPGFICTQLIYPDEYAELFDNNSQPPSRPCILCCRAKLTRLVAYLRSLKRTQSTGKEVPESSWKLGEDQAFQMFREKMDTEDGFMSQYMLLPRHGEWEGFIDPVCQVNYSCIYIVSPPRNAAHTDTNKHEYRRYMDQGLIKYRSELRETPNTGETMAHFY